MSQNPPTISPETANHVLAHYGHGGYPAGSWTEKLISLLATADDLNLGTLAAAYPDYAAAVAAISYDPNGVANLQQIARREEASQPDVSQCPEALYNPDTGSLLRCVQEVSHDWHKTPGGAQWNTPVDSDVEVPF